MGVRVQATRNLQPIDKYQGAERNAWRPGAEDDLYSPFMDGAPTAQYSGGGSVVRGPGEPIAAERSDVLEVEPIEAGGAAQVGEVEWQFVTSDSAPAEAERFGELEEESSEGEELEEHTDAAGAKWESVGGLEPLVETIEAAASKGTADEESALEELGEIDAAPRMVMAPAMGDRGANEGSRYGAIPESNPTAFYEHSSGLLQRAARAIAQHAADTALTLIGSVVPPAAFLRHYLFGQGEEYSPNLPQDWQAWIVKQTRGRLGLHRRLNPYNNRALGAAELARPLQCKDHG